MRLIAVATTLLVGFQLVSASHVRAQTSDAQAPATVWPTKAWERSTPEAQGMDSGKLAELIDAVGARKQDSLLVIRHGRIVAEAYYAPYAAGIPHDLRSVTKSVTGTLLAIVMRKGLLDSVDHPVLDLFSDKTIDNVDDRKKAITVQNLLDMNSGIAWRERLYTPDETVMKMYDAIDRVAFVLDQPMAHAPGERFYYDSGNPYVLSAVITKKTGQSAYDFATKELFAPLGVTSAWWTRIDAQGITDGEAGLFLTPEDMARVGYLYLHDGMWEDKQIVPAGWVERARTGPVKATEGFHYANLWWSLPEKGAFMALGRHSQRILVLPKLDIVAVMTGSMRDDEFYPAGRLVDQITDAVKSDQPLPDDKIAQSVLAASIDHAAKGQPSPVGTNPDLAKTVSGVTYKLDDNPAHTRTVKLTFSGADGSWESTTPAGSPDQPDRRLVVPMGLDGYFRTGPAIDYTGRSVPSAARGRWLGDHTFQIERQYLGHGETETLRLTFAGKTMDILYRNTDGYEVKVHGEAQE